jgi:hypothetical protein
MTAFLRRATSGLRMWLGWDSATFRGFGLGRPGTGWPVWSLLTPASPLAATRTAQPPTRSLSSARRVCVR